MLATQIRQKDGIFYFGSVRAPELLAKVRFISRFYGEGEEIAPARISQDDEIAQFIAKIERTDRAFQRTLSRAKVRQLKNFYETAITQPPIPGTVLLFTPEKLRFQAAGGTDGIGQLAEPQSKFLIIDGQHRLAALRFYLEERPDDAKTINVPCVIFDGRSAQDKWILQAELFNELHRWVNRDWRKIQLAGGSRTQVPIYYGMVRDFFKAAERVWGEAWGHANYMVTKPVTLKAMLRVCADLAREDGDPAEGRVKRWEERLAPWRDQVKAFKSEGFYERFAAKGEVERVGRVHRELARATGIEARAAKP